MYGALCISMTENTGGLGHESTDNRDKFRNRERVADKFLREGHHVTGIDCNKSAIQHTAYRHICMDIRDKMHYPELGPFDIVINNAGVQNNNDIDVNLKGTIDITEKYGIHPGIRAVLMIGSASGHNGSEFPEYVASKGGVLSYTKNIALRTQNRCNMQQS